MNEDTVDYDRTDEEILTYTVSDEALEAAGEAGGARWTLQFTSKMSGAGCC
jgi:hypothetical protein